MFAQIIFMNLIFSFLSAWFLFASDKKQLVDLIIHHAIVYTVDNNFTKTEAFAAKDGKIVAVGSNTGDTQQIRSKRNS